MQFYLGDNGGQVVGQGIGNLFKALAQGKMVRDQAAAQAGLRDAQAYSATQTGNKAGAEAANTQFTLDQRKGVDDAIAADQKMLPYVQNMMRAFKLTGDTNAERVAKAGTEFQTQGIRDRAVDSVDDLDRMNRLNTLADPGKTYMPYDNISDTGTVFNKATGNGAVASSTLDKLFGEKTRSQVNENNARAADASASADSHRATTEYTRTKTAAAKTAGGKPLTAAQLRTNAEIQDARDAVKGMTDGEVNDVMGKDKMMLTPADQQKIAIINLARKPKYGEPGAEQVSPQPNPPPPPKEPSAIAKVFNWLTAPDVRPGDAKSPAPDVAAPNMSAPDGNMQKANSIRAAFKAGQISREEAKRQLQALGFQ